MSNILNVSPYYDDFDESKGFQQILFKPSTPVQSRELTQMQSIFRNNLKKMGDYLFANGNIISGMGVSDAVLQYYKIDNLSGGVSVNFDGLVDETFSNTNGDTGVVKVVNEDLGYIYVEHSVGTYLSGDTLTSTNSVNIRVSDGASADLGDARYFCLNEGVFYFDGFFIDVATECIILDDTGILNNGKICLVYEFSFISAKTDSSLNDPARGTYGYSGEGADRLLVSTQLQWVPTPEADPANCVHIATYTNGVLTYVAEAPFLDDPDYTLNSFVDNGDGTWTLTATGNTNAESLTIDLCDVPDATAAQVALLDSTSDVLMKVGGNVVKVNVADYDWADRASISAEIDSDVATAKTQISAEIDSDISTARTYISAEIDSDIAAHVAAYHSGSGTSAALVGISDVGSYIQAFSNESASLTPGSTRSGAALQYTNTTNTNGSVVGVGTWRYHGHMIYSGGPGNEPASGVWYRIA